ncbi:MAG: phosphoadenylyl-sulfate reductase [Gammaproteobacteria bacterium]|nr:phosphoadenylyl-sulfate reductase [Gammaproteobacteria bacterium]
MSKYLQLLTVDAATQQTWLAELNALLTPLNAQQRIEFAVQNLPGNPMLSSSFGIQAAVMLHLCTSVQPEMPVVLTDTGYLFPETYRFIDELTEKLKLNLRVYRSAVSPAWQEARYGQLWTSADGLKQYNQLNKVEPMARAQQELGVQSWFSGLRRSQSSTRADTPIVSIQRGVVKMCPIVEWSNKDIHYYLQENNLPYHPLWEQGYVSVGDVHSSRPLELGMTEEETRFNGMGRECGLHVDGEGT